MLKKELEQEIRELKSKIFDKDCEIFQLKMFEQIGDEKLKKMPVIVLTTTDDPRAIEKCHELGCSVYIVKPVEYESFSDAVSKIGLFLSVVEVPQISKAV